MKGTNIPTRKSLGFISSVNKKRSLNLPGEFFLISLQKDLVLVKEYIHQRERPLAFKQWDLIRVHYLHSWSGACQSY